MRTNLAIQLLSQQDRKAVEEFQRQVEQALGAQVRRFKLFGSKARGEDTPDSDIDILVEVQQATSEVQKQISRIAWQVNSTHSVFIIPTILSPEDFQDRRKLATPFIQNLLEEPVEVTKEQLLVLAQYRLAEARDSFEQGIILLERGRLRGALNRFYYACLYAARSLLALKQVDSSKHRGVMSLVEEHFVKPGIISQPLFQTYKDAFDIRLKADYEDFVTFSQAQVEATGDKVLEFVQACEKALGSAPLE